MNDKYLAIAPESKPGDTVRIIGSPATGEFVRYFIASLIALAIDAGTLFALTHFFGVHYLVSGVIAFLLGLTTTYLLSITWVFERRHVRAGFEFIVFVIIGLIGLLINEVVLWILTGGFGLFYMFSKIASAGIVFLWNFFARKAFLFR